MENYQMRDFGINDDIPVIPGIYNFSLTLPPSNSEKTLYLVFDDINNKLINIEKTRKLDHSCDKHTDNNKGDFFKNHKKGFKFFKIVSNGKPCKLSLYLDVHNVVTQLWFTRDKSTKRCFDVTKSIGGEFRDIGLGTLILGNKWNPHFNKGTGCGLLINKQRIPLDQMVLNQEVDFFMWNGNGDMRSKDPMKLKITLEKADIEKLKKMNKLYLLKPNGDISIKSHMDKWHRRKIKVPHVHKSPNNVKSILELNKAGLRVKSRNTRGNKKDSETKIFEPTARETEFKEMKIKLGNIDKTLLEKYLKIQINRSIRIKKISLLKDNEWVIPLRKMENNMKISLVKSKEGKDIVSTEVSFVKGNKEYKLKTETDDLKIKVKYDEGKRTIMSRGNKLGVLAKQNKPKRNFLKTKRKPKGNTKRNTKRNTKGNTKGKLGGKRRRNKGKRTIKKCTSKKKKKI